MHLDNATEFHKIDTENMLVEIDGLTQQLAKAYFNRFQYDLKNLKKSDTILLAGTVVFAIVADLLSAYCMPFCTVLIVSLRVYT